MRPPNVRCSTARAIPCVAPTSSDLVAVNNVKKLVAKRASGRIGRFEGGLYGSRQDRQGKPRGRAGRERRVLRFTIGVPLTIGVRTFLTWRAFCLTQETTRKKAKMNDHCTMA